ncbi:GNAT family N-acetyltransferase [Streptomyces nojiriensis]|uniref:GNAT family N-acetyltransferase n=1 Tax=Streptomyces nojiriensis TaxID=66374 RepID=UPI0036550779
MMIHSLGLPPSDEAVDAWLAVLTDAGAADLPQLPAPSRREVAGRLRVRPARGRYALWAADGGAGVAGLVLFTDEGNTHTALLDVLAVRPQERRRGVGTALWERVREELLAQGRTSVMTQLDLGGPGQAFARSLGFENVLPMAWYEQELPADGPARVSAAPGYELVTWHGLVPDAWAPAAAAAHGAMEDAPSGDLDERAPVWTARWLHAMQQVIVDRGWEQITVAAVTGTGEVAAYTELVLPDPSGPRALQHGTVVVPGHRGHGLGRAVKLRMAAEAAARYPALRRIATTVADANPHMQAVNESIGYRRGREAGIFQLKL